MVSHETGISEEKINRDFVLGVASVCATFFHISSARTEQFGMQIKLPASEIRLLERIRDVIGLKNKIYKIKNNSTVILIVRSRRSIEQKIFSFFDDGLAGNKLEQYEKWKQAYLRSEI